MSDIRRVVTGLDAEDRAVVQFDSQLALEPGPFGSRSAAVPSVTPLTHRTRSVDFADSGSTVPIMGRSVRAHPRAGSRRPGTT